MENTLVWCKTKAEVVAVLTEAKKRGYGIDSPTDMGNMFWSNYHEETVLNLNGNGRSITYCYKDWYIEHPSFGNIISADKFLVTKPILITRKGRVVTAEDKNTGEKAIATCSPDDTFDFGTGAMIAVARLIAQSDKGITKDAETVLRQLLGYDAESPVDIPTEAEPKPFKVGSLVTLRPDVIPGIEYNGLTLLPGEMYDTAFGKPIKVIRYDSGDQTYLCKAEGAERSWWYDSDMLEAWDKSKIYEGDIVRVINTGLNYSTYPRWVGEHISDPDMAARYCFGSPSTDGNYKVIKIAEHETNGRTLAYIEQCDGFVFNKCYLVEVKGLEKVTEE